MAWLLLLTRSSPGGSELRWIAAATIKGYGIVQRVVHGRVAPCQVALLGTRMLRSRKVSGRISHPARRWTNRASLCNALGASARRSIRGVSVIGTTETSRVMVNWNTRRRQSW